MTSTEDAQLLRRLQLATTRVLGELDRVCRELDIPYAVYGGTAIGAVRHQGFVPWDDDADVCMTRPDYERFLAAAPARLGPEYSLESTRTTADFPATFAVLGMVDTHFVSEIVKNRPYKMMIGVDVFPLDNLADDPAAFRRQHRETWFWGRLLFLHSTPTPIITMRAPLRQVILALTGAAHWGLHFLRVTPRSLQRRWERAARRYESVPTARLGDFSTRDPLRWSATSGELYPAVDAPFEDITVMLPHAYDVLLTRGFGDYMQLPPEDQRVNHRASSVSFGPYEF